jgi:hypothetical protein
MDHTNYLQVAIKTFHFISADALLKKGTNQHADGWDASSKDWAHMVLHLPHTEGGFGVTFNDVPKDAAFYTTTRGHRPRSHSFVTSIPSFFNSITARRRSVLSLNHRLT